MENENKILSVEQVAEMASRSAARLLYPRLLTIEEASALLASHEALRAELLAAKGCLSAIWTVAATESEKNKFAQQGLLEIEEALKGKP